MDKNKKRKSFIPIILCTSITLFVYVIDFNKALLLLGDTNDYWFRGEAIYANGFSLYNLPDAFRGYVFPLYLGTIARFLGGLNGYRIINSFIVGILFGYILPNLFPVNCRYRILKAVTCFLIFFILQKGVIIYPLSDILAFGICACSVVTCNCYSKENRKWKNMVITFMCGVLCYCAYNIRTIYLFAGIYVMARLCKKIFCEDERMISKLFFCALPCLGGAIAGIPQFLINIHLNNSLSLFVPTSNLMRSQLFWGLQYQRYDTFIGFMDGQFLVEHPNPQMYFVDLVGQALIEKEGITEFASWVKFIKFVFKYPIEVCGIYVRHFINILLPCFPNQYVYDLNNNKILYAILSLIITFLFLMVVFEKMSLHNFVYRNFIPLIIPAIFILPGAVEVRFFIAVYILMIYTLGFNTDWKKLFLYIKQYLWKVLILFVLYCGTICSIWSSLLVSETSYKIFMY